MRNLKKLLAVIVTVAMLATFMVPVFADNDKSDADIVAGLGVLLGAGDGVTDGYLATTSERIQAAVMYLRLLGLEEEAKAYEGEDNFDDASDRNWAKPIMAYLKANAELGWEGDGTGKFKPADEVTAQEYYKVMLSVMGYEQGVDFEWSEVFEFAAEKGLVKIADVETLTNNDIAIATVEALTANDMALLFKLIEDGVISQEKAIEVGLIGDELAASVKVVAADTVEVSFTQSVDPDAVEFEFNFGMLPQEVEVKFSENNRVASLVSEEALMGGEYTLVINGLDLEVDTFEFEIDDQKLVDFEITTTVLTETTEDQKLVYKAVDQYGNEFDVDPGEFTISARDITKNLAVTVSENSEDSCFNVSLTEGTEQGNKVIITLYHRDSAISKSATIEVMSRAYVYEVSFEAPEPLEDEDVIQVNQEGLVLPITLKDQYGNDIKLTEEIFNGDSAEITFISSNTSIVNPKEMKDTNENITNIGFVVNDEGQLVFNTGGNAGEVEIRALIHVTGKTETIKFKVYNPAEVVSFKLQQPTGLVVVGEEIEVPYTALDQHGKETELNKDLEITWISDNTDAVKGSDIKIDEDGKINITPSGEGRTTITAYYKGLLQGSISLNVRAEAKATRISRVSSDAIVYYDVAGGEYTYTVDDFVIVDQYNRVKEDIEGTIAIAVKDKSTNTVKVEDGATVIAADDKTGTKTLTATFESGEITLTRDFNVTVIESNKIVGYDLEDIEVTLLYSGYDEAEKANYAKTFAIANGKDSSGNKVALNPSDASEFMVASANQGKVQVDGKTIFARKDEESGTSKVTVWKDGRAIEEISFTVSNARAAVATMEFDEDADYEVEKGATLNVVDNLSAKDQYGFDYEVSEIVGNWFSSDRSVATVSNGVVTGVSSGTVTISFVSSNNVSVKVDVAVK